MLKRIKNEITLNYTNKVLSLASELELDIYCIEGVLNDSYLIYNTTIRTGRKKPRKYILLTHEYKNSQSDTLYMIQTDNDVEAGNFMKEYEQEQSRIELQELFYEAQTILSNITNLLNEHEIAQDISYNLVVTFINLDTHIDNGNMEKFNETYLDFKILLASLENEIDTKEVDYKIYKKLNNLMQELPLYEIDTLTRQPIVY